MRTLNGQTLKQLLISGSNNLYNHYPEVDALNVFPVPDGDTGMNMNLTLTSGSKEIQNRSDENAYEISKVFSRGLLMGARGNSGVITSQIFRGFSKGLDGLAEVNALAFSAAFQKLLIKRSLIQLKVQSLQLFVNQVNSSRITLKKI